MTREFDYFGARIEIYDESAENVNAKIFTRKKDGSFASGVLPREEFQKRLDNIKNEAMEAMK